MKQPEGKYLEVQILRRRKKTAVHPMVIERLSRLPRKLMPRIFKGFTRKQMTKTIPGTLKATGTYQHRHGFLLLIAESNFIQTSWVFLPRSGHIVINFMTTMTFLDPTWEKDNKHWCI